MTNRLFMDTEFIEDGKTIELISIGIVSQAGKHAFHAVSTECDLSRAHPWVTEHVVAKLPPPKSPEWMPRAKIREGIEAFVRETSDATLGKVEFWGYYADYDWVAFCQLFGTMMDLPPWSPKYCCDLKQFAKEKHGSLRLPKPAPGFEHHALADAEAVRIGWQLVRSFELGEGALERARAQLEAPFAHLGPPRTFRSPFLGAPLELVW